MAHFHITYLFLIVVVINDATKAGAVDKSYRKTIIEGVREELAPASITAITSFGPGIHTAGSPRRIGVTKVKNLYWWLDDILKQFVSNDIVREG